PDARRVEDLQVVCSGELTKVRVVREDESVVLAVARDEDDRERVHHRLRLDVGLHAGVALDEREDALAVLGRALDALQPARHLPRHRLELVAAGPLRWTDHLAELSEPIAQSHVHPPGDFPRGCYSPPSA